MAKYDERFKLKVVKEYLSGSGGSKTVGARHGLGHATVRRWVSSYREHGVCGLRRKGASYDAAFKLQVLNRMWREGWSLTQTAAAFDIRSASHIGRWERQYHEGGNEALEHRRRGCRAMSDQSVKPSGPTAPEQKTLEEVLKENEYLRAENAYPKKARCLDPAKEGGSAEKAQLIAGLRQEHRVGVLLAVAGLSRSTFYYHLKARGVADKSAGLKARISAVYARHKGRYGYRRITAALRQAGQCVNHKTVQKLMRALGLKSLVRPKRYRSYRGEVGRVAPNVLARQFEADRPNQKWVTDVTEFNVRGQKLYLSPVMDLYNGEIVAYETSERPLFGLVGNMLKKAMRRLSPGDQPLLHSDQGWQYQQPSYRRMLADRGLTQSMSRKGNCLDNAAMESWFATLKTECFYLNRYDSIDQLQKAIGQFIHYYNHQRIRLKLKGLSPVQYRTQALAA
ncbi:IS3 family transposase [Orrella dioscoreae]|uniref:IS3 family transposase n=1 Tax=Orrella dioscoreae TaxID=1851544 RepID=UPI000BEF33FD|nr:IS3 family transposase [Orrella dioscoreae]